MPEKSILLPKWLDDYIFNTLSASYCRRCKDLVVLEWDAADILCYLGTYFPRSYAESFSIFYSYLQEHEVDYRDKETLSVFDLGCGTGGELLGFLVALNQCKTNVQEVNIYALDGNLHALRILESILAEAKSHVSFEIKYNIIPFEIDDFYDLSLVENVCFKRSKYDIVISFKAICEFVTRQQLEEMNPYEYLITTFLPHLNRNAIICLADISSYSDVAQDWLPKIIDRGIASTPTTIIGLNENYNESYYVTHSHKRCDLSKIVWRILKSNIS